MENNKQEELKSMKERLDSVEKKVDTLLEQHENDPLVRLRNFFDTLVDNLSGRVRNETVDVLDMKTLLKIVKDNIVEGANQAVVYREKKEGKVCVYVSFAKDREVLPDEKNRHIVIEAKTLDADVEALFDESEIVFLQ